MIVGFYLPYIFGNPLSVILYIIVLNIFTIISFSLIFKAKVTRIGRLILITLFLLLTSFLSLGITAFLTNGISILLWQITGDYTIMDEIVRNHLRIYAFTSVPSSILQGYVAHFAFENSRKRKLALYLILYWIILNSLSCLIIHEIRYIFCGLLPYR